MSCFIVSDYHVSALVAYAIRERVVPEGVTPESLAAQLAAANRAAYSERYTGRYDSEVSPFGGLDRSAGAQLVPGAIVEACDCLEYQTSDGAAWEASKAAAFLADIRAAALAKCRGVLGHDAAAWPLKAPKPPPVQNSGLRA
jgi:hypothetical protein